MKRILLTWMLLMFVVPAASLLAAQSFKAPAFTATDIDGKEHSSAAFLGKRPALLMFWATW